MPTRRPTRAQLADHYRQEWLCERATAETAPCPPPPRGCGTPTGQTCVNPHTGHPLAGPPAHAARIRAAATAAAAQERPTSPGPLLRSPAA